MKLFALLSGVTLAISGCAALTPTKEMSEGYRVYDVKGVKNPGELAASLKQAMQVNAKSVTFSNNIPPNPLPEKPGRFKTTSPFGSTGLGALLGAQGSAVKVPVCEDSIVTATSHDDFGDGAENTTFFVCLLPYANGYHLDIYYSFSKASGGASPKALGQNLARSMVGDSSQFIPRTLAALETAAQSAGGVVTVVESYP